MSYTVQPDRPSHTQNRPAQGYQNSHSNRAAGHPGYQTYQPRNQMVFFLISMLENFLKI